MTPIEEEERDVSFGGMMEPEPIIGGTLQPSRRPKPHIVTNAPPIQRMADGRFSGHPGAREGWELWRHDALVLTGS